jgi:hypothetical protein
MDHSEMGEVETARGDALGDALGDKFTLRIVKPVSIGISEPIYENVRAGIDVGIV